MIAYNMVEKLYAALDKLDQEEKKLVEDYYIKGQSMVDYSRENNIEYKKLIKMKKSALTKLQNIRPQERKVNHIYINVVSLL